MKISIYVENARLTPSAYYRLTQYFRRPEVRMHSSLTDSIYRLWHKLGCIGRRVFSVPLYMLYVITTLYFLLEDLVLMRNGVIIISRTVVPRYMPALHKFLLYRLAKNNKLIWDIDDNILANRRISPSDFHFLSKYCHVIVVTNDFLKSLIEPEFASKARILPTTDGDMQGYDTATLIQQRKKLYPKEIRLVWVATDSGLLYLKLIVPLLDKAAKALKEKHGKKLILHVVCNKPLQAETSHLEIANVLWGREIAKDEIINAHIGLMPLPDTEFTRGKGGFKLVQYMSTAMPVIASSVGFNKQIVTKDFGYLIEEGNTKLTWEDAILELSSDWERYARMSECAKVCYDNGFSFNRNKLFWENLVKH